MLNRENQINLAPFFGWCISYYLAKPWPHVQTKETGLWKSFTSCLGRNEPEPLILSLATCLQQFHAWAFKRHGKHVAVPGTFFLQAGTVGVGKLRQRFIVLHHKSSFIHQTGELPRELFLATTKKQYQTGLGGSFQPNVKYYSQTGVQINSVNWGLKRESVLFHRHSV